MGENPTQLSFVVDNDAYQGRQSPEFKVCLGHQSLGAEPDMLRMLISGWDPPQRSYLCSCSHCQTKNQAAGIRRY